jgi:hypothetical protein
MDTLEAERRIAWIAGQLEAWRRSAEPAASLARRLVHRLGGADPAALPADLFSAGVSAPDRAVRPAARRAR